MLKNYFKIAARNLRKNGLFSWLNIAGLSVGLAVTILLFMFVLSELGFDTMHKNEKDIYRVLLNVHADGRSEQWSAVPNAVGPELKADIPDVRYTARMLANGFGTNAFIKYGNDNFIEKKLYWCDADILKIFSLGFIEGDAQNSLSRPNTAVISESTARKIFGTGQSLGKTIVVDNTTTLEITGIYKDFPQNSTLDCNVIASYTSTSFSKQNTWDNASFETYCLLNSNTDTTAIAKKIQSVVDKNVAKPDQWFSLSLQPLQKIHLYSGAIAHSYSSRNGDINEVKNLGLLALVILLIACINYVNLATARSQQRAKDVGINKTLGASFKDLIIRFYTETGFITLIALVAGVILAILAIPLFDNIAGKHLDRTILLNSKIIPGLVVIWLLITFAAGSYPAIFLARFKPIQIIQQKVNGRNASGFVRKGLVVGQFAASIILIATVIIVFMQLKYIRSQKMGYNPENVVAINTAAVQTKEQIDACLNSFRAQSNVISICRAQGFPGMSVSGRTIRKDKQDNEGMNIQTNRVTDGFINVLQLKLLAGQSLPEVKQDSDTIVNVVLNKTAVQYLGYTPEQAIGKKVITQLGDNTFISGVVADFNFQSLHQPIGAYAFHNAKSEGRTYLLIRFRSGNLPRTIQQFEKIFKTSIPNAAFDYTFLDQHLQTLYAGEQIMASVTLSFSVLAIFIACLGLFGLAAYTAEQRTKEIGVRKVLGASIRNIILLLSRDFLALVLIAVIVATPIAWFAANRWLQGFAYRINPGFSVFILTGLIAMVIALMTVSFQAIKAALANPVKSLRTE